MVGVCEAEERMDANRGHWREQQPMPRIGPWKKQLDRLLSGSEAK